jgi:GNAT superfamily N-acetyltransferase
MDKSMHIENAKTLTEQDIDQLQQILIDTVAADGSVGFMHPVSPQKARQFWQGVAQSVAAQERSIFLARQVGGEDILGTVQLITAVPENQPHRGDIAKMLVHPAARRQGIGQALMQAAQAHAQALGKTLLVLDTVTGDSGYRLYQRCGWQLAGQVPGYALTPLGALVGTSFMYKHLP